MRLLLCSFMATPALTSPTRGGVGGGARCVTASTENSTPSSSQGFTTFFYRNHLESRSVLRCWCVCTWMLHHHNIISNRDGKEPLTVNLQFEGGDSFYC